MMMFGLNDKAELFSFHRLVSPSDEEKTAMEEQMTESEKRELMMEIEELAQIEGLRNYAQSGTELGISAETQTLIDSKADKNEVLKHDGSVALTGDWDAGDGQTIKTEKIMARDSDGLILCEDDGNGIFIKDGGEVGIGTITPLAKLSIHGGLHVGGNSDPGDDNLTVDGRIALGVRSVSCSILMNETDSTIFCDATSSSITVTLPDGASGQMAFIKKLDSTVNKVTAVPTSGTIDGSGSYILEFENEFVALQFDGTNWKVVSE